MRVWTFAKDFDTPPNADAAAAYVALELDGVQTNANVTLNGVALLRTNNMFRQWRAELPAGLLRRADSGKNRLVLTLSSTPSPATCPESHSGGAHAPCTDPTVRAESDAWGWDWSPSLGPVAVWRSVRLVSAPADAAYLASFFFNLSLPLTPPPLAKADTYLCDVVFHFFCTYGARYYPMMTPPPR